MTKIDTTTKKATAELTKIGYEILHVNKTWYVVKDGETYAGFSTKKVAVRAMNGYAERGW